MISPAVGRMISTAGKIFCVRTEKVFRPHAVFKVGLCLCLKRLMKVIQPLARCKINFRIIN